jgi:hypothetical protein
LELDHFRMVIWRCINWFLWFFIIFYNF